MSYILSYVSILIISLGLHKLMLSSSAITIARYFEYDKMYNFSRYILFLVKHRDGGSSFTLLLRESYNCECAQSNGQGLSYIEGTWGTQTLLCKVPSTYKAC